MNRRLIFCLVCVLVLGAFFRIYNLGEKSLWFDESLNIMDAWDTELIFRNIPSQPYLYAAFVYFWKYLGSSEFVLRLPFAVFSIVSILVLYAVAAAVFNEKVGVISALLLAISPFHIYYAQELRMYSLQCLLSLCALYFFIKCLDTDRARYYVYFIFFTLTGIYVHYIAVLALCAENIFFLINVRKYKKSQKKWFIANGVILLALIPFIEMLLFPTKTVSHRYYASWWVPPVKWYSIPITLKNFFIGYNAPPFIYILASSVYLPLLIYGWWSSKGNKYVWLLNLNLFFPILVMYLLSLLQPSYYVDRHFIFSSVFICIFAAKVISAIRVRSLSFAAIMLISVLSLTAVKNYYSNCLPNSFVHHVGVMPERDTRGAANYIKNNFQRGDMICFFDKNFIPQIRYYLSPHYSPRHYSQQAFAEANKGLILVNDKSNFTFFTFDRRVPYSRRPIEFSFKGYKRLWFVAISGDHPIVHKLSSKFKKVDTVELEGLKLYLFDLCVISEGIPVSEGELPH